MKIRKITAGVLAVLMSASLTSVMVSAETTSVGVSADKVTAVAGEKFEINVNLTEVPDYGIMAFDFAVNYDSSQVTITSVTEGDACKTGAAEKELEANSSLSGAMISGSDYSCFDYYLADGSISAMWATGLTDNTYWINETGVLFTIKGTVNADVADGTIIDFTFSGIENADGSASEMSFGYNTESGPVYYDDVTSTNGSVTVSNEGGVVATLRGDVNQDGFVTVADVILINKSMALMIDLDAQQLANGDVTGDGEVNTSDSLKILRLLGGMISEL